MNFFNKSFPLLELTIPGMAYLIINNYIPMAGIIIAFKKIDYEKGILASDWIGLANFEFLFSTPDAWSMTRNTILYGCVIHIYKKLIFMSTYETLK